MKILFNTVGATLRVVYRFIFCINDDETTIKETKDFSAVIEELKSKMLVSYLISKNEAYAPLIHAMEELNSKNINKTKK